MVNFNMPPFDVEPKDDDKEQQPNLFNDAGIEVPTNPSFQETQEKIRKKYYDSIHKNVPITIQYFDLEEDTWSFTPMDSKQVQKSKKAKEALFNLVNEIDSPEKKQSEFITKGILLSKLLEYLKTAFPADYLSIAPGENMHYSDKLRARIISRKNRAYNHFLCNAFSQIFNINLENNPDTLIYQTMPLLDSKQIIERLRLFLDQY